MPVTKKCHVDLQLSPRKPEGVLANVVVPYPDWEAARDGIAALSLETLVEYEIIEHTRHPTEVIVDEGGDTPGRTVPRLVIFRSKHVVRAGDILEVTAAA